MKKRMCRESASLFKDTSREYLEKVRYNPLERFWAGQARKGEWEVNRLWKKMRRIGQRGWDINLSEFVVEDREQEY